MVRRKCWGKWWGSWAGNGAPEMVGKLGWKWCAGNGAPEMVGLWDVREGVRSMPDVGGHGRAASTLGLRGLVGLSGLSAPDSRAHRWCVGAVVRRALFVSFILCNGRRARCFVVLVCAFPVLCGADHPSPCRAPSTSANFLRGYPSTLPIHGVVIP